MGAVGHTFVAVFGFAWDIQIGTNKDPFSL